MDNAHSERKQKLKALFEYAYKLAAIIKIILVLLIESYLQLLAKIY